MNIYLDFILCFVIYDDIYLEIDYVVYRNKIKYQKKMYKKSREKRKILGNK